MEDGGVPASAMEPLIDLVQVPAWKDACDFPMQGFFVMKADGGTAGFASVYRYIDRQSFPLIMKMLQ